MRFSLLAVALVFGLAALPADAQPRRSGTPQQALTAPATETVTAGGADRNAVPGSGCSGFINNARPSATVEVSGAGPLAIYAVSGSDTTMLVSDPNGLWHCSDDANGSNPAVTFTNAAPGTYVVWIGTFSPTETASARLSAVRGKPSW